MLLSVDVAGAVLPWRFLDSARLDGWIAGQPWLKGGGVVALRVSGPRQAQSLAEALRSAVRAADAGGSDVSTYTLTLRDAGSRAACDVLLEAVGHEGPGGAESIGVLSAHLAAQPSVFAIEVPDGVVADVVAQLESASEYVRKTRQHAALTAIVLSASPVAGAVECLILDVGAPLLTVLELRDAGPQQRWASYLHTRIAWDAAGDADRCAEWGAALPPDACRPGADDPLELALNAFATRAWNTVDGAIRDRVRQSIAAGGTRGRADGHDRLVRELEGRRLIWRPLGSGIARPVPWVARALLLERVSPAERRDLLRSCLVCAPLLRGAIARCLELEAYVRTHYRQDLVTSQPPSGESLRMLQAFREGKFGSRRELYPTACPGIPDDPWAFESYGGFLKSLGTRGSRRAAMEDLRTLRNALAHGHFVSWRVVEEIDGIERQLA
jgi:hypothetical protein